MKKPSFRPSVVSLLVLSLLACCAACRERAADVHDASFYVQQSAGGISEDRLSLDFDGVAKPGGVSEFSPIFHLPPVRQDKTGTCWSFAATSLLESELKRLGKPVVKLSEIHTAYWEYVEKARRFVRERGESFLGEGSEPNSALARIGQYGVVRASDYSGLPAGGVSHDHRALFKEFKDYLMTAGIAGDWDEVRILAGVREILDRHLGRPPETIDTDQGRLTPLEYLDRGLGLRPEDYVTFISFQYLPFHSRGEFRVPDNWWHCGDFLNLPLEEFYAALRGALEKGFTAVLAVDFSEPGYSGPQDIAIVPSFDLPAAYIDQSSREYRFASGATTDDHSVHCVGFKTGDTDDWFLVKDSWENAFQGRHKGYFFYRGDYVRLKSLMFMTHKDAVKDALAALTD